MASPTSVAIIPTHTPLHGNLDRRARTQVTLTLTPTLLPTTTSTPFPLESCTPSTSAYLPVSSTFDTPTWESLPNTYQAFFNFDSIPFSMGKSPLVPLHIPDGWRISSCDYCSLVELHQAPTVCVLPTGENYHNETQWVAYVPCVPKEVSSSSPASFALSAAGAIATGTSSPFDEPTDSTLDLITAIYDSNASGILFFPLPDPTSSNRSEGSSCAFTNQFLASGVQLPPIPIFSLNLSYPWAASQTNLSNGQVWAQYTPAFGADVQLAVYLGADPDPFQLGSNPSTSSDGSDGQTGGSMSNFNLKGEGVLLLSIWFSAWWMWRGMHWNR